MAISRVILSGMFAFFTLCAALMTLLGLPADASAANEADPVLQTAPVRLGGVDLFVLRGISSLPAEKRADKIANRIEDIAADAAITPEMLRIESKEEFDSIYAGDHLVVTLVDADAKVEEVKLHTLAVATKNAIEAAIIRYRA